MEGFVMPVNEYGFVIVDFGNDGNTDVSDALQKLIEDNPNRTIYFPDGIYRISRPICTPADPRRSVDLQLSNFAVIRASDDWNSDEAMIRLGGIYPANDIRTCGSVYSLSGGIIDGSMKADGISIDSGRETVIKNVSIKHTRVGIHIKHGSNSGSSDADITNVNIVGNGARDSVGVILRGYDNSLTNMRIADVFTGIELHSSGNVMRNLHPLYTCDYTDYTESCGFKDFSGNNWYNFCYSDHFGVGFHTGRNVSNIYDSCFCMWYSPREKKHTVFRSEERFNSAVTNLTIGYNGTEAVNRILEGIPDGSGCFDGSGYFCNIRADRNALNDPERLFERFLTGKLM